MHRSRQRAAAVFLLLLAAAMPVAALPEEGLDPDRSPSLFAVLWERLASFLGLSEEATSPAGGEATDPLGSLDFGRGLDTDSRSSMDPDGNH